MPGGPPSLCADNGDEIGVGQRHLAGALRAIGEQQRAGVADRRAMAVERLDHAGLIVDLLDGDQRRPVGQHRVERRLVDQPVRADRNDRALRAHRMRHDGMLGRAMRPARRRRARRRGDRDRLARAGGEDDVMTPAERLGDASPRASSSTARAARPSACGELGLAQRSSAAAIAARASGSTGVVAAWSR